MVYGGYSYIDTEYEPSKDDFIISVWVKGKAKFEVLAEAVASESSVGTWTSLKTMNSFVWEKLRARIFKLEKITENSGFVFIAYPKEHFEENNLLQFLAGVKGNWFGIKELEEAILLDIYFPKWYQRNFEGAKHGLEGIRKYLGTNKSRRPHVGTIVKPKVGLSPKEFADVVYKSMANGLDLVKDDENLVNQSFCRFEDRVLHVLDAVDKAMAETGEKKIYVPNITGYIDQMVERMDFLLDHGWKMAMIDVWLIGYAGLHEILHELHRHGFIVHAHRAGHAAETRGNYGATFTVLEKIYRLLGVDQLHTGTAVGKMEGAPWVIKKYGEIARSMVIEEAYPFFLEQEWEDHIIPIMPVASGGLHAGDIEALTAIYGMEFTAQAGGGVHGHVHGTEGGARSMRQAAECVAEGKRLNECNSKELREAIEQWGYIPKEEVEAKIKAVEERWDEYWKKGYEGMRLIGLR